MSDIPPTNFNDDEQIYIAPGEEPMSMTRNLTASRLLSILDAAEAGDTRELFALYRDVTCDSRIEGEFEKRKTAVLGDTRSLHPYDRHNETDQAAVEHCWPIVESRSFLTAMDWLLNATLYPVAVVEKIFAPNMGKYELKSLRPVPFSLLDLSESDVRIFDVAPEGRILRTSQPADPNRYIVHRGHTMAKPDRWGGKMRSLLFWWLLRTMSRQWWATLLERFGTPFLKGTYKDDKGRRLLERAFQLAVKLGGIAVAQGTQVEIANALASGNDAHERFIKVCNAEISHLIVGQTLSSNASPTGELGGGTATLQSEVRDDIRKADAMFLAATLKDNLLAQYLNINGIRGRVPSLIFGADSDRELKATFTVVKDLSDAGFEPDDDGVQILADRVGFGIRRKQLTSAFPFNFIPSASTPLSTAITDNVATPTRTDDLARAFGGHHAELSRMTREADSPSALIAAVESWAADKPGTDIAIILEGALAEYTHAGIVTATHN